MTNRPTQRASRLVRSCNNRCQILFSAHVAAYSSGRLHRAVSPDKSPTAANRRAVAAREQARRFRLVARKDGGRVRLYSRPSNDLTYRFPLIVESVARLRSRSCIIDGEAVATTECRASIASSATADAMPQCSCMPST
jgi:ATP dependent DNA ligase domain